MRITSLRVRDLRRHRDLTVEVAPGLTVIRGPNEAGKTTIQRAIEVLLTRRCTSASTDLDGLRPWDAGDDARPSVAIEFVHEDEDGRRTGRIEKAFRGAKGTVSVVLDGRSTTDPARADELIAELTGIPTEAFFRSTASVRHHEVADLARDEAALRDRLQASISGADRGTSRARKKLEKALADLRAGGVKNPGKVKRAVDERDEAQRALDEGERALAQLERDRDALVAARERRAESDRMLAERRSLLDKARQAERLQAERATAQERFERFRQAVAVRERIEQLQERHPSPHSLPTLRQVVGRLRILDGRMRELRAMLAGEIEVPFEVDDPEPTWRPIAGLALLAVLGGAAVAFGVVLGLLSPPTLLVGGLAAILVGAVLAVLARRWRRQALALRRRKEMRDAEIDRRLRGRAQLEEELRLAEADHLRQLEAIELPDLAAAEEMLAREEEHVATIDRLLAQLEGLVGDEAPERLPGLRDSAALEIEQKTHALEALGPIATEPRARERLEVEARDAEASLERARDDEANARARVEANPVDAEQVAAAAERLAQANERLAAVERRVRVYAATLAGIEAAEAATMKSATRYLERHMAGDIERISGGRYRRVQVDDRTLDIAVWAPERDDWVPLTTLSQGTVDLVYLAARIGLVRLVTGGRRPPLIFDDPFVTLDDDRARRAFELLRDLARDFQVIYLTPSARYDDLADRVVELPGPLAADRADQSEPAVVHA